MRHFGGFKSEKGWGRSSWKMFVDLGADEIGRLDRNRELPQKLDWSHPSGQKPAHFAFNDFYLMTWLIYCLPRCSTLGHQSLISIIIIHFWKIMSPCSVIFIPPGSSGKAYWFWYCIQNEKMYKKDTILSFMARKSSQLLWVKHEGSIVLLFAYLNLYS